MSSDQYFIGLHNGDVVRARAILRLIPDQRWDAGRILGIKTTPLTESTKFFDNIESLKEKFDFPPEDRQQDRGEDPV